MSFGYISQVREQARIIRFEWDEAIHRSNLQKHNLDFRDVEKAFAGDYFTRLDDRFDYGEERFITLGLLHGSVVVIAHTESDEVIRIISVRKATKDEQIRYFKNI